MSDHGIPTDVYIGKASAQWRIHVFTSAEHAISWAEQKEDVAGIKRLFRARIFIGSEMVVQRAPAELVERQP